MIWRNVIDYGENWPHQTTIFRWYKQFKRGEFSPKGDPRIGRPAEAATLENIAVVEKLLEESRRITYWQIGELLHMNAPVVTAPSMII